MEELPAADCASARAQLAEKLPAALKAARLRFGDVRILGTPRRLTAMVKRLAPMQDSLEETIKGPPAAKAWNPDGTPSPALTGFAKKNEVAPSALKEENGYLVLHRTHPGRPAAEVLAEVLPAAIDSIAFPKVMRWDETGAAFSRPLRWIVALLGPDVVPFAWHAVPSGRISRGLRPLGSPDLPVREADGYLGVMRKAGIELDPAERARKIRKQADALARKAGGAVAYEPGLIEEVTDLVESPQAVLGAFAPESLALPRELLISVMRKHQRYFPLTADGQLLPRFITVRNGGAAGADVREGNEHVLRARFADAAYFVREDRAKKLEAFLPQLSTLAFQAKLGSMLEKAGRVEKLTAALAPALGLDSSQASTAVRAARLAKADLATQMVVEMTSLQGIMGRYYALDSGETPEVARAIEEHYHPRYADDSLPATPAGAAVAVADRLDSLAGLFAAGLAPTGARDPFALRRAAIGVIQILLGLNLPFDLRTGVKRAADLQPIPVSDETRAQLLEFLAGRLRGVLADSGFRHDVVEAVLGARAHDPILARRAAEDLARWTARPDWPQVLAAYARCVRITREVSGTQPVDETRLEADEEKALYAAARDMAARVSAGREADGATIDLVLEQLSGRVAVISRFFDKILVMAEDPAIRTNRLGILQIIAGLPNGIADLSKLEGF